MDMDTSMNTRSVNIDTITLFNKLKETLTEHDLPKHNTDNRIDTNIAAYCARRGMLSIDHDGVTVPLLKNSINQAVKEAVYKSLDQHKLLIFKEYRIHKSQHTMQINGVVDAIIIHDGKLYHLDIHHSDNNVLQLEHQYKSNLLSAITGLPGIVMYINTADDIVDLKLYDIAHNIDDYKKSIYNCALGYFSYIYNVIPYVPQYITDKFCCGDCPFIDMCWNHKPLPRSSKPYKNIEEVANHFVDEYMDKDMLKHRQNGILKYIVSHGNKTAQYYLTGEDWSTFLAY